LENKKNLIGFENGVYDIDKDEFRNGRPEDYISLSTGINYVEYNDDEIDENQEELIQLYIDLEEDAEQVDDYMLSQLDAPEIINNITL
jgi:phage/plasmid-associated DNA primase